MLGSLWRIMARPHTWSLPALLVPAQLVLWPALGRTPARPVQVVAFVAVCLAVGVALAFRRTRPVPALVAVCAGIGLAGWVAPAEQQWFLPGDAPVVIALADMIALYSVAVRCERRTLLWACAGVVTFQMVVSVTQGGDELLLDVFGDAVTYAFVAALGRIRRRWNRARADAARRLAMAERARVEAETTERNRLARELHDVTAHHLTSIVVNAQAADFLAEQRPDLRGEALAFASLTGRETLGALHRLVEILPEGGPGESEPTLTELAASFRALGQRITLRLPDGEPPAAIATAMHGIAREALTNTLRYAPGGSVTLLFTYGGERAFGGEYAGTHDGERAFDGEYAELIIEDDGRSGESAGAAGLGGGRGLAGMRERAAALGGTLEAGPRGDGWRVCARVPAAPDVPGKGAGSRSEGVVDAVLAAATLIVPLTGLAAEADEGLEPAVSVLVLLALVAHALPLLWRRTRPWPAFAAVAVTGWLGPLLVATVLPVGLSWLFLFGTGAELAAVYAVAAWSRRQERAWIALVLGMLSPVLAFAVPAAMQPIAGMTGPPSKVLLTAVYAIFGVMLASVPTTLAWLAGHASRRRRDARRDREEGGVASATAQAEARARGERARMAADLRQAVLRHAAEVPAAAERGDLEGVLGAARESLTAMRAMLDGLRPPGPASAVARPESEGVSSSSG
ncbi:histidine kinase [Actinoplanes sp. NPDC051851]|uniref:sensor histidine kinase n=1 Tax=Actinoplanes sp. NPDC051851 TaxID=3154753 RepID=UPI00343B4A9E